MYPGWKVLGLDGRECAAVSLATTASTTSGNLATALGRLSLYPLALLAILWAIWWRSDIRPDGSTKRQQKLKLNTASRTRCGSNSSISRPDPGVRRKSARRGRAPPGEGRTGRRNLERPWRKGTR